MKLYNRSNSISRLIVIGVLTILLGCKSTKSVRASGEASDKLSAKQVIRQHQKSDVDFKTLQAKAKIDILQNGESQGFTFSFRMEKDKVIWLSAPIGVARMMLTPEKVRFYNKLDNEYFDGNYQLLSDFVGVDLDFYKVQNILLGQAIYDLKKEPYNVFVNENSYALHPKDQKALFELFYLINPSHFKMDSLQLFQQLEKRMLQVDYATYQEVKRQIIPQNIRVIAVEDSEEIIISIEFKSVSLNQEVRFPFKIPQGYKEIVIK